MSLYRKYRPQKFSDLIGEDHVRDTLLSAISEDQVSHAYLFAGPRGTGKTSVARLVAKAVNCGKRDELNKKADGEPCGECQFCLGVASGKNLDIVEIDAASNRGIDEIRELRERVKFAPSSGKYKIFIIDEVHMLTTPAFNALLKTLEEPPAHAIFILATTEAHKIPATILSRVQRFDFHRIGKSDIMANLKMISKKEKIEITGDALEAIAVAAEGSHRDSISILEQIASLTKEITLTDVQSVLGLAKSQEILGIIKYIIKADPKAAIDAVEGLAAEGVDSSQINKEIIETLRQLLLVKISAGLAALEVTDDRLEELKTLAEHFSAAKINKILGIFIAAGQLSKETSVRSLPVEMAIVEACGINEVQSGELKAQPVSPSASRGGNDNAKPKTDETAEENPRPKASTNGRWASGPDQPMAEKAEIKADEPTTSDSAIPLNEQSWAEILEKIKEQNHTLNALLRDAKPEGLDGDNLLISVRFKFHHDKISEPANLQIVEGIVSEVLGKKYLVKCQIGDKKKSEIQNPKSNINGGKDLEKAAKEIFEVEK